MFFTNIYFGFPGVVLYDSRKEIYFGQGFITGSVNHGNRKGLNLSLIISV